MKMWMCENCSQYMSGTEILQDRENTSKFYCTYCVHYKSNHGEYPDTLAEALDDEPTRSKLIKHHKD